MADASVIYYKSKISLSNTYYFLVNIFYRAIAGLLSFDFFWGGGQNIQEKEPNPVMATIFRCIDSLGGILEILDNHCSISLRDNLHFGIKKRRQEVP